MSNNSIISQKLGLNSIGVEYFEAIFQQADVHKNGQITGDIIRGLFMRSNPTLDGNTLSLVWRLSCRQRTTYLTHDDFFIALLLVALAQNNIVPSYENITKNASKHLLPKFQGIPIPNKPVEYNQPVKQNQNTSIDNMNDSQKVTSSPFVMSEQEKSQYSALFSQADLDHDGWISGQEAQVFFSKSGLSPQILGKIWQMSDIDQDKRLSKSEFFIAMHLVICVKRSVPLPSTLPNELNPNYNRSKETNINNNDNNMMNGTNQTDDDLFAGLGVVNEPEPELSLTLNSSSISQNNMDDSLNVNQAPNTVVYNDNNIQKQRQNGSFSMQPMQNDLISVQQASAPPMTEISMNNINTNNDDISNSQVNNVNQSLSLQGVNSEYNNAHKEHLELANSVSQLRESVSNATASYQAGKADLDHIKQKIAEHKHQHLILTNRAKFHKENLDELKESKNEFLAILASQNELFENAKDTNVMLKEKVEMENEKLHEIKQQIELKKNHIIEIQRDHELHKNSALEKQRKHEEHKALLVEKENFIESLRESIKTTNDLKSYQSNLLEEHEKENQRLKEEKIELTNMINESRQQIKLLKEKRLKLRDANIQLKSENKSLRDEYKRNKEIITELKTSNEDGNEANHDFASFSPIDNTTTNTEKDDSFESFNVSKNNTAIINKEEENKNNDTQQQDDAFQFDDFDFGDTADPFNNNNNNDNNDNPSPPEPDEMQPPPPERTPSMIEVEKKTSQKREKSNSIASNFSDDPFSDNSVPFTTTTTTTTNNNDNNTLDSKNDDFDDFDFNDDPFADNNNNINQPAPEPLSNNTKNEENINYEKKNDENSVDNFNPFGDFNDDNDLFNNDNNDEEQEKENSSKKNEEIIVNNDVIEEEENPFALNTDNKEDKSVVKNDFDDFGDFAFD